MLIICILNSLSKISKISVIPKSGFDDCFKFPNCFSLPYLVTFLSKVGCGILGNGI